LAEEEEVERWLTVFIIYVCMCIYMCVCVCIYKYICMYLFLTKDLIIAFNNSKCFFITKEHIRMISKGSCDSEDCDKFSFAIMGINYILK